MNPRKTPDSLSQTEQAGRKHSAEHVSGRPVVMALAGAMSHDRERRRKSGGSEREEEGKTESRGGGEDGEGEVKAAMASQA